jgi:hypothetical protein
MRSLSLICIVAFAQLPVQCCAHNFRGADDTMQQQDAVYSVLSSYRRLTQQPTDLGISKSLSQVCPTTDISAAPFICKSAGITLEPGELVSSHSS